MKKIKRCLALLLAALLSFSLVPTTAFAVEMQAGVPSVTINTASSTVIGFGGKQWVLIDLSELSGGVTSNKLTLLLANGQEYGTSEYNPDGNTDNFYPSSQLHDAVVAAYNQLSDKEKLLVSNHVVGGEDTGGTQYSMNSEKFWALDDTEVALVNSSLRMFSGTWWLRSPGSDGLGGAGVVHGNGNIFADGIGVNNTYQVRPAFDLNISTVIFTSAASGTNAKPANASSSLFAATPPTGAIKFTFEDTTNLSLASATPTAVVDERTIRFDYAGATPGKSISAVVTNAAGDVRYYGKLADSVIANGAGTAHLVLPDDFSTTDKLLIFTEECNGTNNSDFASVRREIPVSTQVAPSVVGADCMTAANNDGQITGTTTAMEYRVSGTTTWTTCSASSTTGLAPGSYQVRSASYVGSGTVYLASPATTVTVGSYVAPPTYSVTLNQAAGGVASALPTNATAGTTITLEISSLATNYSFVRWEVSSAVVWITGDENSQSASFALPSSDVSVTPVYLYTAPEIPNPPAIDPPDSKPDTTPVKVPSKTGSTIPRTDDMSMLPIGLLFGVVTLAGLALGGATLQRNRKATTKRSFKQ